MAWAIVGVYAAAAILSARTVLRASFPAENRDLERAFWVFLALAMAFLAVNKELDLQALMTASGRCAAQAQGWYDARRAVQVSVILALVAAVLSAVVLLFWLLRATWRRTALPLLGLALVAGFVIVRAVGFHHVDALIGVRALALRPTWLLELPGPLLIVVSALMLLRLSAPGRGAPSRGPARAHARGRGPGSRRPRG